MSLNFANPYYPYSQVPSSGNALKGAEYIPQMLLNYMLDLPDANHYVPSDDNSRPRVRFIKYVLDDSNDPLSTPLPTPEQKLSLIFDPEHPELGTEEEKAAHPFGYRLMWQHVRKQSILDEQTLVKCYVGRVFDPRPYHTTIGIRWDIWVGSGFETNINTGVESRSFAIEQAIRESFTRVNITGIGPVSFSRSDHADNGSTILWTDGAILGRTLHMSIDWMDNEEPVDEFCDC